MATILSEQALLTKHAITNGIWLVSLKINVHTNRHTAVIYLKLMCFADIELQLIVVAPCNEALHHSSVLLCKKSLNEGIGKAFYVITYYHFINCIVYTEVDEAGVQRK